MTSAQSANPQPARPNLPLDTQIAVLEALAAQGEMLIAQLGRSAPVFRSRLRAVDPGRQFILVEIC